MYIIAPPVSLLPDIPADFTSILYFFNLTQHNLTVLSLFFVMKPHVLLFKATKTYDYLLFLDLKQSIIKIVLIEILYSHMNGWRYYG